jgi:transforming growth factor-beta-induced protein
VEGEVEFPDLVQSEEVETVHGGTVELQSTHHGVRINDQANIMATEMVAANGIIHPIDAVLLPPELRE